jgi:hypothetical protein|uniref:PX domain-containing protein n=1 Tax=Globisporangium ultimum (strain ATCC 200006 / CBS 805.95 / DAOM BR144) TaxID=431595 RepID=K3WD62_GLOUD
MATVLRDIDVDIVRIQPHGATYTGGSPQYVFAVHPLNTREEVWPLTHQDGVAVASTFIGSTLRPIDESEFSIAHEAARSYSQCRSLFKELKSLTNSTKNGACQCCCFLKQNKRCPLSALFPLLDASMFPRKRLFRRRTVGVFQERRFALTLFIKSVLQKLQALHEADFLQQQELEFYQNLRGTTAFIGCKVVAALLRFLELDERVALKIREQHHSSGKLNLEGWHSDRKNLYFINEDANGQENGGATIEDPRSRPERSLSKSSSTAEEIDLTFLLATTFAHDVDEKEISFT